MAQDDVYGRYSSAQQRLKDADARFKAATAAWMANPLGDGDKFGMSRARQPVTSAMVARGRVQRELDELRPQVDMQNARLAGANSQIATAANSANQRAAIGEQAQLTESAEGTADLLVPEAADTATPGGASGRRRRKTEEVGSIRI